MILLCSFSSPDENQRMWYFKRSFESKLILDIFYFAYFKISIIFWSNLFGKRSNRFILYCLYYQVKEERRKLMIFKNTEICRIFFDHIYLICPEINAVFSVQQETQSLEDYISFYGLICQRQITQKCKSDFLNLEKAAKDILSYSYFIFCIYPFEE